DLGWRDLWATPSAGLAFGAIAAVGALLIAAALVKLQALPMFLPLAGGFLLLRPPLSSGLSAATPPRRPGHTATLGHGVLAASKATGCLSLLSVLLLIIYLACVRMAFLLFMLFFGTSALPSLPEFVPTLLFTPHGLGLLVTGTAIGAVLAMLTFAIS